jgi:hypothetical protein
MNSQVGNSLLTQLYDDAENSSEEPSSKPWVNWSQGKCLETPIPFHGVDVFLVDNFKVADNVTEVNYINVCKEELRWHTFASSDAVPPEDSTAEIQKRT